MVSMMARSLLCTIVPSAPRHGARDGGKVATLCDFLDGEIELVARDKVDARRCLQARLRLHRDLRADHANFQARFACLGRLDGPNIGSKGRRRVCSTRSRSAREAGGDILERQSVRRRIVSFEPSTRAAGWAGKRIPARWNFATHLIPCAGAPVEAVERRCLQK
jgi:hypothetical protein